MSILAIGIDCDPTIIHFLDYCRATGVAVDSINLREVAAGGQWRISLPSQADDFVELGDRRWNLEQYTAVYSRAIDLTWQQRDPSVRNRWFGLLSSINVWLATTELNVINRPHRVAHNGAKSHHEFILSGAGFAVPASISSADPALLACACAGKECVCKALSGGRGTTRAVTDSWLEKYDLGVPLHLQERVRGIDIRFHVIKSDVVGVAAEATAVDYRAPGARPKFSPWPVPHELRDRLVHATEELGLAFAGWDFKRADDGTYWCLEVNPLPGYSMYDRYVKGEISAAILRNLLP